MQTNEAMIHVLYLLLINLLSYVFVGIYYDSTGIRKQRTDIDSLQNVAFVIVA